MMRSARCGIIALFVLAGTAADQACASGVQTLDVVEVQGQADDGLSGAADSASQGSVTRGRIEARPAHRPAELLETTPGLIVTQHSGEGKATQYFLRGVNLDHGTDLAITLDGMPVNMRTHGHGQGYADLNFFIPELAAGLKYKKGPYYAQEGDFSATGALHINYLTRLDGNFTSLALGNQGYRRSLFAGSPSIGNGNLLYGLELQHQDGPWTSPDNFRKINGVLRYSQGSAADGFDVTAMAYRAKWNSTDQIPQRALADGSLGRFDALDASDGGVSSRYSLSGSWRRASAEGLTQANAYVIRSRLNLFSNFTFCLNDIAATGNCERGDQFEQSDTRTVSGFNLSRAWFGAWGERAMENTLGLQVRNDDIRVGLYDTTQRTRTATTREDRVGESSMGLYAQNSLRWTSWLRSVAGLRSDTFRARVNSDNALNSGAVRSNLVSPKLSLIFGPWARTEYYVNYGSGFHSNDARGSTINVDPKTGAALEKSPLLVRTKGVELGVRTTLLPGLQSSLALFRLDFDSELLFIGDAGTTEASRTSRRTGFEFANHYRPNNWLTIDADVAFARARFRNEDPAGPRIPGAVEGVASVSASVSNLGPWSGTLKLRYFGPRPLIEDNSVRSLSTTLASARLGYRFERNVQVQIDVFNLFDRRSSQIDYFYESQLRNEAAPRGDVHFHPVEPRSLRVALIVRY